MAKSESNSVIQMSNTETELNLTEVTMRELNLLETIQTLSDGGIILLTSYDNKPDKDMLVRFRERGGDIITQVTQPTSAMDEFLGTGLYWSIYDVSFNMLSLYPTYLFDSDRYGLANKFEPSSTVEYESTHGGNDIAVVQRVYSNDDGDFYYTLSGEEENNYFREEDLKEV